MGPLKGIKEYILKFIPAEMNSKDFTEMQRLSKFSRNIYFFRYLSIPTSLSLDDVIADTKRYIPRKYGPPEFAGCFDPRATNLFIARNNNHNAT